MNSFSLILTKVNFVFNLGQRWWQKWWQLSCWCIQWGNCFAFALIWLEQEGSVVIWLLATTPKALGYCQSAILLTPVEAYWIILYKIPLSVSCWMLVSDYLTLLFVGTCYFGLEKLGKSVKISCMPRVYKLLYIIES